MPGADVATPQQRRGALCVMWKSSFWQCVPVRLWLTDRNLSHVACPSLAGPSVTGAVSPRKTGRSGTTGLPLWDQPGPSDTLGGSLVQPHATAGCARRTRRAFCRGVTELGKSGGGNRRGPPCQGVARVVPRGQQWACWSKGWPALPRVAARGRTRCRCVADQGVARVAHVAQGVARVAFMGVLEQGGGSRCGLPHKGWPALPSALLTRGGPRCSPRCSHVARFPTQGVARVAVALQMTWWPALPSPRCPMGVLEQGVARVAHVAQGVARVALM